MMDFGCSTCDAELARLAAWHAPAAAPIAAAEYVVRLERARRLIAEAGADALLVNAGKSLLYYAGLDWAPSERLVALLVPRHGMPVVICPMFEAGSVKAALGIEARLLTWEEDEDPAVLVADALRACHAARLLLDPEIGYGTASHLASRLPAETVASGSTIIDGCRMYKSVAEIAIMSRVKAMTLEVQRSVARILRLGITTTELRWFIDDAHRALGAAGSTFQIIQFGLSTTSMHADPGELALREGDAVIVDTGCNLWGYNSDITRSYFFGEADAEQVSLWNLEAAAQQAAFAAARPGVPCEDVDAAARKVLERAGLGPGYKLPGLPHRTGHGIGLAIHEPTYLVRGNRTLLGVGMCFSNEPMIVLPGRFGIRIEDHFHITEEGASWFTQPPTSLEDPVGSIGT